MRGGYKKVDLLLGSDCRFVPTLGYCKNIPPMPDYDSAHGFLIDAHRSLSSDVEVK